MAEERRVLAGFLVVAAGAVLSLAISATFIFTGLLQTQFEAFFEATEGQLPPGLQENFVALTGVSSLVLSVLWPFVIWARGLARHAARHTVFRWRGISFGYVRRRWGGVPSVRALYAGIRPLQAIQVSLDPTGAAASILGLLSSLISLAFFVWFVVLVVIGAAQARNISYGESTGSCAISCAGCFGIIIGIVVILGVIISIVAGAAGSQ